MHDEKGTVVKRHRPVAVLLTSHWLSLAGTALVTTAVLSWLFLFGMARGSENPYLGILNYLIVPAGFFFGLILIPIGAWLSKGHIRTGIESGNARRKLFLFLGVTTLANLVLGTQFTYRAVEHMGTVSFCGQSCHVMQPEFRAAQVAGHSRVACVDCHVAPGAAGWFSAKFAGTRQLLQVTLDSYPKPIPSALETNRLVAAETTCERCHSRNRLIGARLRVIPQYDGDEANSVSHTVLMMLVGGGAGRGIHGAHLDPDVEIRYTTADSKRQGIPWVQWRNKKSGETREYGIQGSRIKGAELIMQCVDCHNRPAHTFENPAKALDRAFALGEIPTGLPFAKKHALELLQVKYASQQEADVKIRDSFRSRYENSHAHRRNDVERAAGAIAAIYLRNVFPDLKVDWGTYVNNGGHTEFPGCFRCHDGNHSTRNGNTIANDCSSCHEVLAVEEQDPEILTKLNLAERIANLRKP